MQSNTAVLTGPADLRDVRRLAELEVVIDRSLAAFVEVGEALIEVRDSKLYRLHYPSFEAYCHGRWGFTDRRARQLMEATEIVGALPTGTTVPVTESQARELAPVLRDHGAEVAAQVMAEASENGKPTAATVRAAALRLEKPDEDELPRTEADQVRRLLAEVRAIDVERIYLHASDVQLRSIQKAARDARRVLDRFEASRLLVE